MLLRGYLHANTQTIEQTFPYMFFMKHPMRQLEQVNTAEYFDQSLDYRSGDAAVVKHFSCSSKMSSLNFEHA